MGRIWSIYKIAHKDSGKAYIGQTSLDVTERWRQHCAPYSKCPKLRNAIQKHGMEAFAFESLLSCVTQDAADASERLLIAEQGTVLNGYNIAPGGDGGVHSVCRKGHEKRGASRCSVCNREKTRRFRAEKPEHWAALRKKSYDRVKVRMSLDEAERARASARAKTRVYKDKHPDRVKESQRVYHAKLRREKRNAKRVAKLKAVFQDFSMEVFRGAA